MVGTWPSFGLCGVGRPPQTNSPGLSPREENQEDRPVSAKYAVAQEPVSEHVSELEVAKIIEGPRTETASMEGVSTAAPALNRQTSMSLQLLKQKLRKNHTSSRLETDAVAPAAPAGGSDAGPSSPPQGDAIPPVDAAAGTPGGSNRGAAPGGSGRGVVLGGSGRGNRPVVVAPEATPAASLRDNDGDGDGRPASPDASTAPSSAPLVAGVTPPPGTVPAAALKGIHKRQQALGGSSSLGGAKQDGGTLRSLSLGGAAQRASPPAPAAAGAAGGRMAWLQQRQVEVELSLRPALLSAGDVAHAGEAVAQLALFVRDLSDIAAKLRVETGLLFQDVLHKSSGRGSTDFDSQAGTTDAGSLSLGAVVVPMHQSKVIDRSERLAECEGLEALVGAPKVALLVRRVRALRSLLRVKVEDANDLRMATRALEDAWKFFRALSEEATAQQLSEYALWNLLRAPPPK